MAIPRNPRILPYAAAAAACVLAALPGAASSQTPASEAVKAFALSHDVPDDGLADAGRGAARGGDPGLTQKAYALAYDAVQRKLVPQKQREIYTTYVLPALRAGCVAVIPVKDGSIAGAAATYDDVRDEIKIPDFEMSDAKQASRILHELVHVGQDAGKMTQPRLESEGQAYAAENEYGMRLKGVLQEQGDGMVAIHAGDITSMEATERLLIYMHAVENMEKRRSDLNDFTDGSSHGPDAVQIKGSNDPEVLAYLKSQAKATQGLSDSLWAMATQFGGMSGGAVKNTDEIMRRDGLTHCGGK